jgi:hypothetical protein
MADPDMINRVMNSIAATFNKNHTWKTEVHSAWRMKLKRVKDSDLYDACNVLCSKHFEYPPQGLLGLLVKEVECVIKQRGGIGLSGSSGQYNFCENCIQRDGVVEVSASFLVLETQKVKHHNAIARCECEGSEAKYPRMGTWRDLQMTMQHDGRIQLYSFHSTNARQPNLPLSIRNPDQYKALQQQIAIDEQNGKKNPYLWVVDELASNLPTNEPESIEEPISEEQYDPSWEIF